MRSLAAYKILLGLAAIVFALDQATKYWVVQTLPLGAFYPPHSIEVIPGFFNLVHVGNTGAAWSLFSGHSEWLALIGFVALALLWFFRETLQLYRKPYQWAFGLIVGGIIGNVIDRLIHGHVIDFLDFYINDSHYPSFNVADSGITVGVATYIIVSFFEEKKKPAED